MKRSLYLLPASLAAALAVAGCGGGLSSNDAGSTATAAPTSAPKTASGTTVDVRKTDLGRILVDSQGRTLYLFEADKNGKSACSGACASAWPPVGSATAGTGAAAKLLSTTKRGDGTMQATYDGHPLYLYAGDSAAGQTNGEGSKEFGAEWYVLAPSGKKVEEEGS